MHPVDAVGKPASRGGLLGRVDGKAVRKDAEEEWDPEKEAMDDEG